MRKLFFLLVLFSLPTAGLAKFSAEKNCVRFLMRQEFKQAISRVESWPERQLMKLSVTRWIHQIEKECKQQPCSLEVLRGKIHKLVLEKEPSVRLIRGWASWSFLAGGVLYGLSRIYGVPSKDSALGGILAGVGLQLAMVIREPIHNFNNRVVSSILGLNEKTAAHMPTTGSAFPSHYRAWWGERRMGHNESWGRNVVQQAEMRLQIAFNTASERVLQNPTPEGVKKAAVILAQAARTYYKNNRLTFSPNDPDLISMVEDLLIFQIQDVVSLEDLKKELASYIEKKQAQGLWDLENPKVKKFYNLLIHSWFENV